MGNYKGEFVKTKSVRMGLPIVSFVLANNNMFPNETINVLMSDATGSKQKSMSVNVQKGVSYMFNLDTVGWEWTQYDLFSILDNTGRIIQQWQCQLPQYENGTCPHCHGTKKCPACNGQGISLSANYQVLTCLVCSGTGICMNCYVPVRSTNSSNTNSSSNRKATSIAEIQGEIRKTELELERVNKLLLDYKLRQDFGIFYSSQQRYALSLEHKIQDLYDIMRRLV